MNSKNPKAGVVHGVVRAISGSVSVPLIPIIAVLSSAELMVVRGAVSALCVAALFPKHIAWPKRNVVIFSILFSLCTLAFYNAVQVWGANPPSVIFTLSPVVVMAIKYWRGEKSSSTAIVCLIALIAGIAIALNPWEAQFNLEGFLWSMAGMIIGGISFVVLSGITTSAYNTSFTFSMATAGVGLVTLLISGDRGFAIFHWDAYGIFLLLIFGILGGVLWSITSIKMFEHLPGDVASVLSMSQTPVGIICAYLMIGEVLTAAQILGVVIALAAATTLSVMEARASKT